MLVDEFKDDHSYFVKIVDADTSPDSDAPAVEGSGQYGEGGKIIGFAKWVHHTRDKPAATDLPQWPEGCNNVLANHFFGTMAAKHVEYMGATEHFYLELLASLPAWQGKGAGTMGLKWGIEKASQVSKADGTRGVHCYLEASPVGKKVYERQGFREIGRLTLDVVGKPYDEVFMKREFTT